MPEYTIHGGDEGKKHLDILVKTIEPGTARFLEMAGINTGMHCLDLACGGGTKGKEDEDFIIKFMVKRGRKNKVINTPEPPALITKGQNEKLYNFFSRFIDIENQGIEVKIFE